MGFLVPLDTIMRSNERNLKGLNPIVYDASVELVKRCYERGVQILITQGFRSIDEQNDLYAQGRTKKGVVVTNARGGHSYHNYGLAIDFALYTLDGKRVLWDVKIDQDRDGKSDWMEVVEEAKKLGFEWGGDWKTFIDRPHFQMAFGLTISDLLAGKKPPTSKGAKPVNDDKYIPSSWAKESWESATKIGLVDGNNPQGVLTREMFAVAMMKVLKGDVKL